MKKIILSIVALSSIITAHAQDSTKAKELQDVMIKAWMRRDVNRLPEEQNGYLNSGKKSEVITIGSTDANVALKTARQLFAKVPGVSVYDMDGSGNQLNIATRGLDPHRSWEFNIRQNGVIINSDMYGYPASHYSAPMESFEKIELVRGTGSLQYGAQFGGMINYITKQPDSTRPVTFESVNTVGSFGLVSSYNAVSGTIKKFSYSAYYYRRHSDGYRDNSQSDANAHYVQLGYRFSNKLNVQATLSHSEYRYQIPGPLNDSMFAANPRMSSRSRNYFSPDIYVPSIVVNWQPTIATRFTITASGVFGTRNSVQLDAFANVPDTIDHNTLTYKNRQVDIDRFNSRTLEARLLHQFHLGKIKSKLVAGVMYMNNDLNRRQLGKGTTGSDYDLTLVFPFIRDLHLKSDNIALFAENAFSLTSKWTVSPGIRYEDGKSNMSGVIGYYAESQLPTEIRHQFASLGISSQYLVNTGCIVYGGISQAYRPVIFKDIIPASTYEQIDKNLKDAKGYNVELGTRGKLGRHFQYDVTLFQLLYRNRMGSLVLNNSAGQPYIYRTNIGDSRTNGVEMLLQYKQPITNYLYAGLFTSTSYMNARYINGQVGNGTANKTIKGNKVESTPEWISRNGLELLYKSFSGTILYSYTSASFADALNTEIAPATGAKGIVPAYGIWDVNTTFRASGMFTIRAGINNVFNKQYFTKRPTFYPGPGIWPSDGRNAYITVGVKI